MKGVDASFRGRYGPWALVAGSVQGIGAAFARRLAERGCNLVLVDQDEEVVSQASRLVARHRVEARAVVADLARPDTPGEVCATVDDAQVGLVVYNAAVSMVGSFLDQPLDSKLQTVDVNCRALLALVHHLAPGMAARGRGGLIVMSSLTGMAGHARVATYGATKAFALVLAEALWSELAEQGVDVLAVCPGPTRTPGFQRSRSRLPAALVMEPDRVAREALGALGRQPVLVPGTTNRLAALFARGFPSRRAVLASLGHMMRSVYPR